MTEKKKRVWTRMYFQVHPSLWNGKTIQFFPLWHSHEAVIQYLNNKFFFFTYSNTKHIIKCTVFKVLLRLYIVNKLQNSKHLVSNEPVTWFLLAAVLNMAPIWMVIPYRWHIALEPFSYLLNFLFGYYVITYRLHCTFACIKDFRGKIKMLLYIVHIYDTKVKPPPWA